MSYNHSNRDKLNQLEWLFEKRLPSKGQEDDSYEPYYGDVTELNTNRLILDSVGKNTLRQIAEDAIDLLETSVAVYESNGDYAFGMFSSGWCQLMDTASRKLCHTDDNRVALDCGCWLCHENCWNDSAKAAIESGQSTDIQCIGGINLYAEPIYAGKSVVGTINIGYGTPPTDLNRLKDLADTFDIDLEKLEELAAYYNPRPRFLVDLAKKRLRTSANLIGEMVEKSILQKKLQENKTFLESTNRMVRVGGWELDIATSEVIWTEETYRIHEIPFDYKPPLQEAIKFFHHEDRGRLEKAIKRSLDHGEPYDLELRFITAKGNHLWTRTTCQPKVVDGQIVQLKGTFQDITRQKNAEEALRKSEKDLRKTQQIAHLGSWRLDLATNQVEWTKELYHMYGFDPTRPPPPYTEHMKLFAPESWERLSTSLSKTIETGIPYELELETVREDGSNGWMWVRGETISDAAGKTIGLWGAAQDITERKQAEKQRDKLISDLQKTLSEVKTLRGFLPICSHCKKIRDDKGYWNQIESYIRDHSEAEFSHSVCQECAKKYYPDMDIYDKDETQQ